MHGIVFVELNQYVKQRLGAPAWKQILRTADLEHRVYFALDTYPDGEMQALVPAIAGRMGLSADKVMEEFGEFIAPTMLRMYSSLLNPQWKTLDVLEHTEDTIHRVVRMREKNALPPELECSRSGPAHVIVKYSSGRRMCAVAKGIVRGVARHFGEVIEIQESMCMQLGANQCQIHVRRLPGSNPGNRPI